MRGYSEVPLNDMFQTKQHLPGQDPALRSVLHAAAIVAASDVAVLVCGEAGTGKETLARGIHADSPRGDGPFVVMRCSALSEEAADALLFGQAPGGVAGAEQASRGQVQVADGGTLLLDEVAALPLGTQARLLRLIESGECLPNGAVQAVPVDVRIIAASERDLDAEVAAGHLSRELHLRLAVVPLSLPALRRRPADIPTLFDGFVEQAAAEYDLSPPRLKPAALALLRRHDWPGNLRELRNLAERLVILLAGREIGPENLPDEVRAPRTSGATDSPFGFRLPERGIALDALEADILSQALTRTAGNRTHAARMLGITRDTLLYRLKKHALR